MPPAAALNAFTKLALGRNIIFFVIVWRSQFRPGRSFAMLALFGGSPARAVSEPVG